MCATQQSVTKECDATPPAGRCGAECGGGEALRRQQAEVEEMSYLMQKHSETQKQADAVRQEVLLRSGADFSCAAPLAPGDVGGVGDSLDSSFNTSCGASFGRTGSSFVGRSGSPSPSFSRAGAPLDPSTREDVLEECARSHNSSKARAPSVRFQRQGSAGAGAAAPRSGTAVPLDVDTLQC